MQNCPSKKYALYLTKNNFICYLNYIAIEERSFPSLELKFKKGDFY